MRHLSTGPSLTPSRRFRRRLEYKGFKEDRNHPHAPGENVTEFFELGRV